MDNSHVSLVAVSLRSGGFDHFRCDRPISLGFNAANMGKILKCAGNDDIITLKAEDDGDALTMMFESPNGDRIADFGELVWGLNLHILCVYCVIGQREVLGNCVMLSGSGAMQVEGVVTAIGRRRCIRDDRVSLADLVHVMWYFYGAPG